MFNFFWTSPLPTQVEIKYRRRKSPNKKPSFPGCQSKLGISNIVDKDAYKINRGKVARAQLSQTLGLRVVNVMHAPQSGRKLCQANRAEA